MVSDKDVDVRNGIRSEKGGITTDFCCAIPRHFPKDGRYSSERVFVNESGKMFTKKYSLIGDFKESDEEERIFLSRYWKLYDGKNKTFYVNISEYLTFKNIDPWATKNSKSVIDYVRRSRSNTIQMNYLFDHQSKAFEAESAFGLIQDYEYVEGISRKNTKLGVLKITWSDRYFNRLKSDQNWKWFNMNQLSNLPSQSSNAKKLTLFIGQRNSEFSRKEGDVYLFEIDISILSEFYLALPKSTAWKHKVVIKRALETLKTHKIVDYDNLENCFFKKGSKTYVQFMYTPESADKALMESEVFREKLTNDERFYLDELVRENGIISKFGITRKEFEENYLCSSIERADQLGMSLYSIVYAAEYVLWGSKRVEDGKIFVQHPKVVFQRILGIKEGGWDITPLFVEHWKNTTGQKLSEFNRNILSIESNSIKNKVSDSPEKIFSRNVLSPAQYDMWYRSLGKDTKERVNSECIGLLSKSISNETVVECKRRLTKAYEEHMKQSGFELEDWEKEIR